MTLHLLIILSGIVTVEQTPEFGFDRFQGKFFGATATLLSVTLKYWLRSPHRRSLKLAMTARIAI